MDSEIWNKLNSKYLWFVSSRGASLDIGMHVSGEQKSKLHDCPSLFYFLLLLLVIRYHVSIQLSFFPGLPTDPKRYWEWKSRPTHQSCHPGTHPVKQPTTFGVAISETKDLRAECLYRGLNTHGDRERLENELFEYNNRWWRSEHERIADHNRRLQVWQTATSSPFIPFPHFNNLPTEIQEMI